MTKIKSYVLIKVWPKTKVELRVKGDSKKVVFFDTFVFKVFGTAEYTKGSRLFPIFLF